MKSVQAAHGLDGEAPRREAEQLVVERLKPWLVGRTCLIVTHRPAMLALVDRLIVMDGGRIRLDGPKATVIAALAASAGAAVAKPEGRSA